MKLALEPAAHNQRTERRVVGCLGIAAAGSLATVVGDSMLHGPGHSHTIGCALLVVGIAMVTAAAMIIALFATREDETRFS